jgi:hypothetical protein
MGFKADDGTEVTTTTGATTSAGATAASGSSSDDDGEGWRKLGGIDDERVSDDEEDEVDESATSAAAAAVAAAEAAPPEMAEAGSSCSMEDRLGKLNSDMPSLAKELADLTEGGSNKEGVSTAAEGIESAIKALTIMLLQRKPHLGIAADKLTNLGQKQSQMLLPQVVRRHLSATSPSPLYQ